MRPLAFLTETWERFGDVFTIELLHEGPWVIVADPDLVREVFRAPPDVLRAGEGKRVLGINSLLLLDEERHMEQRRLLLPPFGPGHVERYEAAMRAAAERAIWAWPVETAAAAIEWTSAIALEVILQVVFGVREGERLAPLREALGGLRRPSNERESRTPAFRHAIEHLDGLIFAEIAERAGDEEGDDVLSLLLAAVHEDGSPMTREEIRDELMTLLVAGYETTATTLAWALERLARNPAALDAAGSEAVAGGGPYIDATIKKTLRLRPALPVLARAVKAPYRLGEHLIPPGATVAPAILLVHHRPDLYPEPEEFRPERFLDAPPQPHAWIPFGGGVRRCIGARSPCTRCA